MSTVVTVIHCIACFLIVGVVLLQSGKGSEVSSALGGSSQTLFGSSGGANFFTRLTAGLAAVFMLTSLTLTILSKESQKSVFEEQISQKQGKDVPSSSSPAGSEEPSQEKPSSP